MLPVPDANPYWTAAGILVIGSALAAVAVAICFWLALQVPSLIAWGRSLFPREPMPAPLTDRELAALLGQVQITYHDQAKHFKHEETKNPSPRVLGFHEGAQGDLPRSGHQLTPASVERKSR